MRRELALIAMLGDLSTASQDADWHAGVMSQIGRNSRELFARAEDDLHIAAFKALLQFSALNVRTWHEQELWGCLDFWDSLGIIAALPGPTHPDLERMLLTEAARLFKTGDEAAIEHALAAIEQIQSTELDDEIDHLRQSSGTPSLRAMATAALAAHGRPQD